MNLAPAPADNSLHAITDVVKRHLVPILNEALDVCVERHFLAKDKGADGFSFGTDAWSLPARLFRDNIENNTIPFELDGSQGCVLRYENFRVRHHRVGQSESENILTSFPNNANGVSQDAERQLAFEGDGWEIPTHDLVLAFFANAEEGLCACYLTTIKRTENGRIAEWGEAIELFRRDAIPVHESPSNELAPEEKTVDPTISRNKRRKDKETDG